MFVCLFFRVSVAQYILVRNLLGLCLGDVGLFIFLSFFYSLGARLCFLCAYVCLFKVPLYVSVCFRVYDNLGFAVYLCVVFVSMSVNVGLPLSSLA